MVAARARAFLATATTPFRLRDALIGVPAILLVFVVGVTANLDIEGAIAAGSAYSVGFGAPRRMYDRPWVSMIGATLTMALATAVGSLVGHMPLALVAVSGIAAGACGWLALHDEDQWWVALQATITLFVAGYFAGTTEQAVVRTGMVLAGGLVQTGCVLVLRRMLAPPLWPAPAKKPPPPSELTVEHVVGTASAVMLAALAALLLHLANAYWAPMTALLVLKPGLRETGMRGLYRIAGTMFGCLVAGLTAIALPAGSGALAVTLAIAAGLSYALQKANYAMLTSAVTATVVFLLALGHAPELETSEHRILATLVGGGLALAVAAFVSTRHAVRWPRRDVMR